MFRTAALVLVCAVSAVVPFAAPSPACAGIEEIDYATYDAKITDKKGVTTEVSDLGYATGANILLAYRGEAEVEIPFRLIRSIEIGEYVAEQRRAPVTVVLRSGKSVSLEIDSIEEGRLLKGKAEFGEYRIRTGKIRRLELLNLSHTDRA
ncbi:MAG: hypothetical protein JNM10_19960 [Planctomycetia bacterium]|nr:hypothetical protein [Planctomycetia bacterium]